MNGKILRVGLAIGGGTGPELAEIFERTLRELAAREKMRAEIIRSPREYRTYRPMAALTSAEAARATEEDAADYIRFVRELAADGIRVAFRTAFNAQSLYLVRDELLGVKVEPMRHSDGELLLIRDETQGFYSGRNDQPADPLRIRRETLFSRENTWRVLDFSIENAAARWGGREHIDRIIVACKFHLLENRFAQWVRDYERERSVRIHLYQPDTTNRQLMRGAFDGRTVLVGSNEWGDIMHAELIARFGLGHQEERCARNFFLHPDIAGFVEYQTVHGSADDIAGRGIVNPVATLRAAARVIEEFTGSPRIVDAMEEALGAVARENIATPDAGGSSTNEVVDAVLTAIMNPNRRTQEDLLIVVDMQGDFLAADGRCAQLGLIDSAKTSALATRVNWLLDAWRATGRPVAFTQTIANGIEVPPTLRERNKKSGRDGWLRPGSPGAQFCGVSPRAGEAVFAKSGYDPFLNPQFEIFLRRVQPARLVLAGAFTDVCIDALARTAFQKGFRVAVVEDATLPLRRGQAEALDFMRSFYDIETLALADFDTAPRG